MNAALLVAHDAPLAAVLRRLILGGEESHIGLALAGAMPPQHSMEYRRRHDAIAHRDHQQWIRFKQARDAKHLKRGERRAAGGVVRAHAGDDRPGRSPPTD